MLIAAEAFPGQAAIDRGDVGGQAAVAAAQGGVDPRGLAQPQHRAGQLGVGKRRDEGVQRFQPGLAALVEAGQIAELEREAAEFMPCGEVRGDHFVIEKPRRGWRTVSERSGR